LSTTPSALATTARPLRPTGWAQVQHGLPDLVGDGVAGALLFELFAQRTPLQVELGFGVVGVVRVVEVDRRERAGPIQQQTEAPSIHGA
jgi:hypothetical protein